MKHQCIVKNLNDLHSDGMYESPLSTDVIEEKELDKILAYHNNKYTKKRKTRVSSGKTDPSK